MNTYEWSDRKISRTTWLTNKMLEYLENNDSFENFLEKDNAIVTDSDTIKAIKMLNIYQKDLDDSVTYVTAAYKVEPLENIWLWVKKELDAHQFKPTVHNIHRILVNSITYNPEPFNKIYTYLTSEEYNKQDVFVPDKVNIAMVRKWINMLPFISDKSKKIEVNEKNDIQLKKALYEVIAEYSHHYLPPFDEFISSDVPNIKTQIDIKDKECVMAIKILLYLNGYNITCINNKIDSEFFEVLADFKKYKTIEYASIDGNNIYYEELKVLFTYKTEDDNE